MSEPPYCLLEIERDRLARSLAHLERSVVELRAALAEAGPDPDYRNALNEDLVVIAKQRARIAALDDEIRRAKGIAGDIGLSQLAAVPVDDSSGMPQQQQQQQQQDNHMAADQQQQGAGAAAVADHQQTDADMEDAAVNGAVAAAGGSNATEERGIWL